MPKGVSLLLQKLNYFVFMALIWYFSTSPPYRQLEKDQAVITLAFAHAGACRKECRRLSPEELAKLPPNMRNPMDCPRERSPITIELLLDDELVVEEIAQPPGLYKDQGVDIFRRVKVPVGEHRLLVRMNDDARIQDPTYTHEQTLKLEPEQMLVVDFNSDSGEFVIK